VKSSVCPFRIPDDGTDCITTPVMYYSQYIRFVDHSRMQQISASQKVCRKRSLPTAIFPAPRHTASLMADQRRGSKCRHGDAIVNLSSTRKRPSRLRVTNHDPTFPPSMLRAPRTFTHPQITEPRVLRFRSSRPPNIKNR